MANFFNDREPFEGNGKLKTAQIVGVKNSIHE